MKPKIKFVYFDVGGVLLYWRDVLVEIASLTKRPLKEVESVYFKYDQISCRGKITPFELGKKMKKDLRMPKATKFDYEDITMKSFYSIPETHKFIKKLAKIMPVGLLTNTHLGIYDLCIKHGSIPNLDYRVIVESCKIGLIKPEKEIFIHAQKMAKVPARNILFTDDSEDNIDSALDLGWNVVHFDTDNPSRSIADIQSAIGNKF